MGRRRPAVRALVEGLRGALCWGLLCWGLLLTSLTPAVASAQGTCELAETPLPAASCAAPFTTPDFVFLNPPCSYTPGPYPEGEADVQPHAWPLPGGAVQIEVEPGLGTCHGRYTVRHTRGRRVRGRGAVDLDLATCGDLQRLARNRGASAITVETSWGQRPPDHSLDARAVRQIGALGGPHLTLDVAVNRSEDLRLLAPVADRIVSLRVRVRRRGQRIDLAHLPAIPCLQALAVQAREVTGVAALSSPSLNALEVRGRLPDADVAVIAGLASLRELRVYPRGPARIARFEQVRQIERLHTRAAARVLDVFRHNRLRRLVLEGPAGAPVVRAIGEHFQELRVLDLALHDDLSGRRLRALAPLRQLETLLVDWRERPPRLPAFSRLSMFVAGGALDRATVTWINAQPALRTVHSPLVDEVLQPMLRRARGYAICRNLVQEELTTD